VTPIVEFVHEAREGRVLRQPAAVLIAAFVDELAHRVQVGLLEAGIGGDKCRGHAQIMPHAPVKAR
jgi:hypothetical protein